jgi:hypothetical protein
MLARARGCRPRIRHASPHAPGRRRVLLAGLPDDRLRDRLAYARIGAAHAAGASQVPKPSRHVPVTQWPSQSTSDEQGLRVHALASQAKFAGQSVSIAHAFGAQRWSAPHAWPSEHAASDEQPLVQRLLAVQAHGLGSQMAFGMSVPAQLASSVHSDGPS